jgi:hypothetical protein
MRSIPQRVTSEAWTIIRRTVLSFRKVHRANRHLQAMML